MSCRAQKNVVTLTESEVNGAGDNERLECKSGERNRFSKVYLVKFSVKTALGTEGSLPDDSMSCWCC